MAHKKNVEFSTVFLCACHGEDGPPAAFKFFLKKRGSVLHVDKKSQGVIILPTQIMLPSYNVKRFCL
jgi:hypothetical protein